MSSCLLPAARKTVVPLLLALTSSVVATPAVVRHELTVDLDPDRGRINVVDRVHLSGISESAGKVAEFYLNGAFDPVILDSRARLELVSASPEKKTLHRYRLELADGSNRPTLSYSGKIAQADGDYDRGHIGEKGVFLSGASAWYPAFDDSLLTFSLRVRAPQGWAVISQGTDVDPQADPAPDTHFWGETRPQTDIVLIAGRFSFYKRSTEDVDARVYLRRPDPALAERYLEAASHYLGLYARLLVPYPYDKFALVENFWETGYGMPSLALLGPRVSRFPFILHSSFPHEILHNWWGNGVYLDPAGGNWSEGLTAYLADHLVQEQRGRGADYRRAALQKYVSYVDAADDFPLSAFRGKHGEVSEAVGYNKAMMLFHMLRQRLGEADFLNGLRRFFERHRFQPAGYDDLRRAFEDASGIELSLDFRQWVVRTGAPLLRVSDVHIQSDAEGHRIKGVLQQEQAGAPYRLQIPVAVQLRGQDNAIRRVISMETKRKQFDIVVPSSPIALHVDPEFDLFRRLAPGEAPASLGDLLGAKDAMFILPGGESADAKAAYERLARALGGETAKDSGSLPGDKSIWLLGWDNAHLSVLAATVASDVVEFTAGGLRFGSEAYDRSHACVVVAARRANNSERTIGFIGCDNAKSMAGLARKVPHYGKYGFLAFTGDQPVNVRKDEWPVRSSPMSVLFDPKRARFPPPLPPRRPLSDTP